MRDRSAIGVYLSRKMAVLLGLGFSSGLPLGLTGATLQAWLTDAGVDVGRIGLFSLVGVPYTFKFVWSPVMDRYVPVLLGRRRGWLLVTQLAVAAALLAMAAVGTASLWVLGAIAVLTAFLSASQDVVADAYRTDVLDTTERGAGAATFVTGYRVAMLVGTGATLALVGQLGWTWPAVYAAMAAAMGVGIAATLLAPEPTVDAELPRTLAAAVVKPFGEFFRRPESVVVLAFIVLFRAPDEMLNAVKMPLLLREVGYSKEEVGWIGQSFGLAMSIAGAILGGGVVARLGVWRSLWLFGVLQAMSNLAFMTLLATGRDVAALVAVTCVENVCGGLVTAGFVAYLMSQCDHRYSATQYALLSSLMAVTRMVAGAPAGYVVEAIGWGAFLAVSVGAILPALGLLPWLGPRTTTGSPLDPAHSPPTAQATSPNR